MQTRRRFIGQLSLGSAGLAFATGGLFSSRALSATSGGVDYFTLTGSLLKDWCDGMLAHQIDDPADPVRHGALACPSCDFIHGRCWEALYPFMYMAKATGESKYLAAAIKLFDWSKNVSGPDGRWTNDLKPGSWQGTSIFGAIALAEAVHYHGDLLDEQQLAEWKNRLDQCAGGYLWNDFVSLNWTNVNYGFTSVYGFDLMGKVLGNTKYTARSRQLAKDVKNHFTEPNKLLFGEGKPYDIRSDRGLLPVDLGYNVEESLNGVVLYAIENNDDEMLKLLDESLASHLEFMLPDGTWDNSWGTRQFKWTCWGSRTSDGCQPGFSLMASRNPAFGTAACKNLELYARCTADGLLHGGPHFVSHGIPACIHHTFAHAKVLAWVLDHAKSLPAVDKTTPLPREIADGVKEFPEIAVWLAARGPWRATVSAYDSIYSTKKEESPIQQATGGALAILFHMKAGMIFAASMAEYLEVEPLNQQENPEDSMALTPRIESTKDQTWFTNLYDLKAVVKHSKPDGGIRFDIRTSLQDKNRRPIDDVSKFDLQYLFEQDRTTITAGSADGSTSKAGATLVLPVISQSGEKVTRLSETRIEITKPGGTLIIESTVPLAIGKTGRRGRVFNQVPGCEAVPILAKLPDTPGMKAACTIRLSD